MNVLMKVLIFSNAPKLLIKTFMCTQYLFVVSVANQKTMNVNWTYSADRHNASSSQDCHNLRTSPTPWNSTTTKCTEDTRNLKASLLQLSPWRNG